MQEIKKKSNYKKLMTSDNFNKLKDKTVNDKEALAEFKHYLINYLINYGTGSWPHPPHG